MEHPHSTAKRLFNLMGSKARRCLSRREKRYIDEWLGGLGDDARAELLRLCDEYRATWDSKTAS